MGIAGDQIDMAASIHTRYRPVAIVLVVRFPVPYYISVNACNVRLPMARLEMCTAPNALLDRLPNLRADDAYPPAEISGFMLRGPASLHVRFG